MTLYTYAQLESLWIQAGGPSSQAPLMAAIAMAESGGNSAALNCADNNDTQCSVGLWQVSNGTKSYPSAWTTAQGNAAEAVSKYNSQGLTAWGTYTSGAYKKYLSGSVTPDSTGTGGNAETAGFLQPEALPTTCLLGIPGFDLGVGSTPAVCLVQKSWLNAILGGLLMVAGGMSMAMGTVLLMRAAFGPEGLAKLPSPVRKDVPGREVPQEPQSGQESEASAAPSLPEVTAPTAPNLNTGRTAGGAKSLRDALRQVGMDVVEAGAA